MTTRKLSTRIIDSATIPEGKRERLLADGAGLFLLVRPTSRSWMFEYVAQGKKRRMVLGQYPLHSIAAARDWADEQRRLIDHGDDPQRNRAATHSPTGKTLGDLMDCYRDHLAKRASGRQVANILKNHLPADLRKVPLAIVTKADIATPLRKLVDSGHAPTAGKLRSYLMTAFKLAHGAADNPDAPAAFVPFDMPVNPIADLRRIAGAAGATHEKVMTVAQLRTYATALQNRPQTDARDLLLVSLYCGGQRLAQVARATLEKGDVLVIADTKGKRRVARRHALPLLGIAKDHARDFGLADQRAVDNLVDAATSIVEKISGGDFTQRMIRRTIENLLIDAGFGPSDTGLLLSHGQTGVQVRHYLRGDRLDLKRRMLEILHGMLTGNVVPLRAANEVY